MAFYEELKKPKTYLTWAVLTAIAYAVMYYGFDVPFTWKSGFMLFLLIGIVNIGGYIIQDAINKK